MRQSKCEERRNDSLGIDAEDFDTPIHIRQISASAIGRNHQTSETELSILVWLEQSWRDWIDRSVRLVFCWKRNALHDLATRRINHNNFGSLASSDQSRSVSEDCDCLRAHSRKFHQLPRWSEQLICWRHESIVGNLSYDSIFCNRVIYMLSRGTTCHKAENCGASHIALNPFHSCRI